MVSIHIGDIYIRQERMQNLEEAAIRELQIELEATPEDHRARAALLDGIGVYLGKRYGRTGNLQAEAAVEATPEDHPDRIGRLNNLGCHLSRRYERTGDLKDLEATIALSEAAVEATQEDHPNRAAVLNNLGSMLNSRYERTGNLQDLEAAIARSEAAVEATPEDHPNRAGRLNSLGCHLNSRYERIGNLQDLEAAIGAQLASWSTSTAPILIRLAAAVSVAKMLVFNPEAKDLSRACSLLSNATHLIPLATSRSLEREDQ